jgi:hypothetical protein
MDPADTVLEFRLMTQAEPASQILYVFKLIDEVKCPTRDFLRLHPTYFRGSGEIWINWRSEANIYDQDAKQLQFV